jgi:serine/threonine-protein phosphatase PP1 catalytic subunit
MNFQEFFKEFKRFDNKDSNSLNDLIEAVLAILKQEPVIIPIKNGINSIFVGDTHGDFRTAAAIIKLFFEENFNYLFFLGDYVDRGFGDMQIKLVNLLLHLKKTFPQKIYLLRGNHEWNYINAEYGFKDAVFQNLDSYEFKEIIYQQYNKLFGELPLAIKIEDPCIFAVHGGVPIAKDDYPFSLKDIARIPKKDCFTDEIAQQILWNDPSDKEENCIDNYRGLGYIFGIKPFREFMHFNNLSYCIRSHELQKSGYNQLFEGALITIFSSKSTEKKVKPNVLIVTREKKLEFREINDGNKPKSNFL